MPLHGEEIMSRVRDEVEAVHSSIAAWFRGEGARDATRFDAELAGRFEPGLVNIQPSGRTLTREELLEPIRQAFAANPRFEITISDVVVRWTGESRDGPDGLVLATYHEHQTGARNTVPSSNTRVSTVLFRHKPASGRLTWLHIHETALPA